MQPADQEGAYNLMLRQYAYLKRLYFSTLSDDQYDDEGQLLPSQYPSKAQIIQRFQTMKVKVPTRPSDPMTPITQAEQQAQDPQQLTPEQLQRELGM